MGAASPSGYERFDVYTFNEKVLPLACSLNRIDVWRGSEYRSGRAAPSFDRGMMPCHGLLQNKSCHSLETNVVCRSIMHFQMRIFVGRLNRWNTYQIIHPTKCPSTTSAADFAGKHVFMKYVMPKYRSEREKKIRDTAPAINLIRTVIKGNYYFIAMKRDVNVTDDPS